MKNRIISLLCAAVALSMLAGCASRKKNTATQRAYHAFVARYNTGYNGSAAYKKGYAAQLDANKDNYLELLPILPISNEGTEKSGSSDFDRAIEKAQKSIKLHSIKKKPVRRPGQRLTPAQKAFYARKEFNPYLQKMWMLMGNAYFQKGEYLEAASTYSYMMRLYSGQPRIVAEARLRMAECYTQLDWLYEAEDLLTKAARDTLPPALKGEYARAQAGYLLKQQRYAQALPHVEQAMQRKGRLKKEKAREQYLLAQLSQLTGNREKAAKAYRKVISMSPPYELEFSARIRLTEVTPQGDTRKMIRKLESMAKNPNNENYLDQIYYAKGNLYMAARDTVQALAEYEKGVEESKSNYGKKVLQQQLTAIYWAQGAYDKAQPHYSSLVGLMSKDDSLYPLVDKRSRVLEKLVVHTVEVQLQDSLQRLAALPQEELYAVIDKLIEEQIAREEEEKRKAEEEELMAARQEALAQAGGGKNSNAATAAGNTGNADKSWYFYNPQVVAQGKAAFEQRWGKRKDEDNWRRRNKTVLADFTFEETDYSEPADTLAGDSTLLAGGDSIPADTLCSDPHERQYYLQQIPFSDEMRAESDAKLSEALYNTGVIAKDELEDKAVSQKALDRVTDEFPDFEKMPDVLYNLFQLHSRWGTPDEADHYRSRLQSEFADHPYTQRVSDPNFARKAVYGKQIEDSAYAVAYDHYRQGDFAHVLRSEEFSSQEYPDGAHRPKFMFLKAMSDLQMGEQQNFLEQLKEIVQKYPQNEISELAGLIAQGLQDGRLLGSGSFGSIWERRRGGALSSDSLPDSTQIFSAERFAPFCFILAYPQDSVSENALLFEMARYNFTNYMVRNFSMEFVNDGGIGMLQIKEFINYDECLTYMQRLYAASGMAQKLQGLRPVVISTANLALLLSRYSFADYQEFYEQHFSSIPQIDLRGYTLDEPDEQDYKAADDYREEAGELE